MAEIIETWRAIAHPDLTLPHIETASYNTKQAAKIEAGMLRDISSKGKTSRAKIIAHRAHVMGAVIFAAAFVEASINNTVGGLNQWADESIVQALRVLWADDNFRLKTQPLEKYKHVGRVYGITVDRGSSLSQEMSSVLKLRNYYVHGKPDEITVELSRSSGATRPRGGIRPATDDKRFIEALEQELLTRPALRDAVHPVFQSSLNSWLNQRGVTVCLAQWAVNSCIAFVDDFETRIGLPNRPWWVKTYGV